MPSRGTAVSADLFGIALPNVLEKSAEFEVILWRRPPEPDDLLWEECLSTTTQASEALIVAARAIWDLGQERFPDSIFQIEFHANGNRIVVLKERP